MDISKKFELRCMKCRYAEFWTGLSKDVTLYEIKKGAFYNGQRFFRCPKCGFTIKAKRIQGNATINIEKKGDENV